MNQQNHNFPLFFTLERVDNGYILTAKDENGSLSFDSSYRKEVVLDEKIFFRIGQLLHPDALVKEHPVVYRVEAVRENTYKSEGNILSDSLMEAKLAFAHFKSKDMPADSVLALLVEDTRTIEIYGLEAEKIAHRNNAKVIRSGGIPMLRFPDTKDGKKHLASLCSRTTLMSVSQEQILQWYASHQAETEKAGGK